MELFIGLAIVAGVLAVGGAVAIIVILKKRK